MSFNNQIITTTYEVEKAIFTKMMIKDYEKEKYRTLTLEEILKVLDDMEKKGKR